MTTRSGLVAKLMWVGHLFDNKYLLILLNMLCTHRRVCLFIILTFATNPCNKKAENSNNVTVTLVTLCDPGPARR